MVPFNQKLRLLPDLMVVTQFKEEGYFTEWLVDLSKGNQVANTQVHIGHIGVCIDT